MSINYGISSSYYRKLTYVPVILFSIYLIISNLFSIRSFIVDFSFLLISGFLVVIIPYFFPPRKKIDASDFQNRAPSEGDDLSLSPQSDFFQNFNGKSDYLILARDKEGTIIDLSIGSESFWGYSQEGLLKEKGIYLDIVHPDDREMVELHLNDEKDRHGGGLITDLYKLRKSDGEIIFVRERRIDYFDEYLAEKKYQNIEFVLLKNETHLFNVENKNEEMDDFFSKIFRSIPDIFLIVELQNDTFVDVNSYFVKMLKIKRKEIIQRSVTNCSLFDTFNFQGFKENLYLEGGVFNQDFQFKDSKKNSMVKSLISGTLINLNDKDIALITIKILPEVYYLSGSEFLKNSEKFPLSYGHFSWKIFSNEFNFDEEVFRILRLPRKEAKNLNLDLFFKSAIPEDKVLFQDLTDRIIEGNSSLSIQFSVEDKKNHKQVKLLLMIYIENEKNVPSIVKGIIIEMV